MSDTRTLKNAFNSTAEWRSDKLAFVQAGDPAQRLTYSEANTTARRLANALRSLGIAKGDRVAILSGPTVNHALTFYACQKIGAIPTTLHARETPTKLQSMVNHVGATALLFQPKFGDLVSELRPNLTDTEHYLACDGETHESNDVTNVLSMLDDASPEEPETEVEPSDTALINFTSGSTGRPKAIVHSHENCIEAAHDGGQIIYGTRPSDVFLNIFTPSFIAWSLYTLPTVNVGGSMVFFDEWEPADIPAVMEEERITVMWTIPTIWKQVLTADFDAYDVTSVRQIGFAGEPMSSGLYRELSDEFGADIVTCYGSTETLTSGTVLLPEEANAESVDSIGKPVPNVNVRIVDPTERDPEARVEDGEVGELLIRGPSIATGVWDEPERAEELFHEDEWWLSGDLGYVGEDGNIRLEGRVDNMIISGGINIHAENVERILEQHDAISQCVITPMPHEEWGQTLEAHVIATGDVTETDLEEWCREHSELSNYQRPRSYVFVDDFPRTPTGKVDRVALEESSETGL